MRPSAWIALSVLPAKRRLELLRHRVTANVAETRALVVRRAGRREPVPTSWRRWAAIGIGLVVPTLAAIDPVFGAHGVDRSWVTVHAAVTLTHLGSSGWMYYVLAILIASLSCRDWLGLAPRQRLRLHFQAGAALYCFISVALCEIAVTLLKQVVGRARPRLFDTLGPYHLDSWSFDSGFTSFPSGHAATIACAATCAALLFPRVRLAALLAAVWIAGTRMVGGAHYPSDIVAGLMFGAWIACFVATRFANAGLLFDARLGSLPAPKRGFHVLGVGLHRRLAGFCVRLDAVLGPAPVPRWNAR